MTGSIRLASLALTAAALVGTLGAQPRTNPRGGGRSPAPRGQPAARGPRGGSPRGGERGPQNAGRGYAAGAFGGGQRYAGARPEAHGFRSEPGLRGDPRGRNGAQSWGDGGGRGGYRVHVADHGRPLFTRAGVRGGDFGRSSFAGGRDFRGDRGFGGDRGFRGHREFRDGRWYFGGRAFPIGWESRVVFGGFFPVAYAGYCDAVPYDYDYLLPPMLPSYDPCLFGDRIIVYDRFSRGIVFVAGL